MRTPTAVAALLFLAGCQAPSPPEMAEAEIAQIEGEVLEFSDQWLEAGTNLDSEGVAALLDRDDGHFVSGANYRANWDEFLAGSQELYGSWEEWGGEWDERRVDVLGPGVALFTGQATGPVRTTAGTEYINRARFTLVVRKTEGQWKALYGHISAASTPIQ